jgi:predicted dehydrogenase
MEESFSMPADSVPGYGGARSVALLQDWINVARTGAGECRNSTQSLLAVLEVLDRIYESSAAGRRIECRIGGAASVP